MAVILVADDEEMILHFVSAVLEAAGHRTVEACNGLEAVSLFRSYPDRFDLVVTDLQMPTMNGFEAIKLIRQTRPSARILCMSGYTETLPPGMAFLAKPFLAQDLRRAVEDALAAG
jgi:CheY-like chemotaxis protein